MFIDNLYISDIITLTINNYHTTTLSILSQVGWL